MIIKYLRNRDFVLGLGVGMILAAIILWSYIPSNVSDSYVEKRAHEMGMKYTYEIKAYFNDDTNK